MVKLSIRKLVRDFDHQENIEKENMLRKRTLIKTCRKIRKMAKSDSICDG